ncbi:hypothetical protein KY340_03220 [Candidatus Woesearchaeota archaeon]|nr:hypothetical protein [Candidatus Woesearchaeota archaeon]
MLYTNTTYVRALQEREQGYRENFDSLDEVLRMRCFVRDLESEVDEYYSIRKNTPRKIRASIDDVFEGPIKFIKDYRSAARMHLKQTKKKFSELYNMLRNFTRFTGDVDDLRQELDKVAFNCSTLCIYAKKCVPRKIKQYLSNRPYVDRLRREIIEKQSVSSRQIPMKKAITLYQEADRYDYFEGKQLLFPYQDSKQPNPWLLRLAAAGLVVSAAGISASFLYKFFSF